MRLSFGKRQAVPERRRSAGSEVPRQLPTSDEWKRWLHAVATFRNPRLSDDDIRPFVAVTLFDQSFRGLVDTGAAVNLFGDRVKKLVVRHRVLPSPTNIELRMADGSTRKVNEVYNLRGVIDGKPHSWEAHYIPKLTSELVLGMRCLQDLDLIRVNATGNPHAPSGEPEAVMTAASGVSALGDEPEQECGDPGPRTKPILDGNDPIDGRDPHGESACEAGPVDCLTDEEARKLSTFLEGELPLFEAVSGRTTLIEHSIRLKDSVAPIKQRHYPRNPAMQAVIEAEVATMLNDGVIEPSDSPWSSPVVLIKKSTGKYRFCIDFRRVNDSSVKDAYPLPRINAILEKLRQAKYISTLDLRHGYWQVPLAEDSRPVTAFTVPGLGLFQFCVMPFGLHSAGATFQRLLDRVIGPRLEPHSFAYLDDLVIVSSTLDQHLDHLHLVFERLREAGLRLNPEKCHFGKRRLKYLGHVVSSEGIATDPEKVRAIREFPVPKNLRSLRSFLGLASWYRRFIEKFADVSAPLRHLLKKNAVWSWGSEQDEAFDNLKRLLSQSPVLACPDFSETLVLQVDASNSGLGAALTQKQNGHEVVVAYASRLLTEPERNYSTTEQECLALVWAIRKFKPYLEGYHFVALTDHSALSWLMKLHEPSGRLARWIMELQQFDFEVRYRKGSLNRVADALSRQPVDGPQQPSDDEVTPQPSLVVSAPPKPPAMVVTLTEGGDCDDDEQRNAPPSVTAPKPAVVNGDADANRPTAAKHRPRDRTGWYERIFGLVTAHPEGYANYCIRGSSLFRAFRKHGDRKVTWKMCVPLDKVRDVLVENHDQPTAGHLGTKKTLNRIGAAYFWPGWRHEVKEYVKSCERCQEYKVAQVKPAGPMYFRKPQGPWYSVSMDLVGPLPRSRRGHRFLLVMQDMYSKWVELVPIASATAQNVVAKTKEILLRYGAPEVLITDNGTQFVSKIFRGLADDWSIEFRTTAPYSPQSNPVERTNRVVKTMIAQYVRDNHKAWGDHLAEFQFAINTAVHDSTAYTPAMLCFGRELKPPRAIRGSAFEPSTTTDNPPLTTTHSERLENFRRLYEKTRQNLRSAYQRQARHYNLRRREVKYQAGDLVMRRIHVLSSAADAIAGKLAPKFQGPCRVIKTRGVNMYEVEDSQTGQTHVVHVKDLKPCYVRTD